MSAAIDWGSTADERSASYPCEEFVPNAVLAVWRAIDIAAPMVAAAEKNVAAVGLRNVSTRVCPADALSADMEPFDAAIGRMVLMLVPDPVAAARAVLAVLRPGGAFSVIVPGDQAKAGFNAIRVSS